MSNYIIVCLHFYGGKRLLDSDDCNFKFIEENPDEPKVESTTIDNETIVDEKEMAPFEQMKGFFEKLKNLQGMEHKLVARQFWNWFNQYLFDNGKEKTVEMLPKTQSIEMLFQKKGSSSARLVLQTKEEFTFVETVALLQAERNAMLDSNLENVMLNEYEADKNNEPSGFKKLPVFTMTERELTESLTEQTESLKKSNEEYLLEKEAKFMAQRIDDYSEYYADEMEKKKIIEEHRAQEQQPEQKESFEKEEHSFLNKFGNLLCEEIVLLTTIIAVSVIILLAAGFGGQLPMIPSVSASALIVAVGAIIAKCGLGRRNKSKTVEE